jgi:hypothetical protein
MKWKRGDRKVARCGHLRRRPNFREPDGARPVSNKILASMRTRSGVWHHTFDHMLGKISAGFAAEVDERAGRSDHWIG